MTKAGFYHGKQLVEVEWWLAGCNLPDLAWARLRVFDDGTADSTFGPREKLYGFENRDYAGCILSEDEYCPLDAFDADDEREYGIKFAELKPPHWEEDQDQPFEYLGTY
jgi:hypothetical protein